MAYEASDGKRFSMLSRKAAHDRTLRAKSASGVKAPEQILDAPMAHDEHEGEGHEDPAQVHAEHGPAISIRIKHDHEKGQHSVHSAHEDGHIHKSEHASAPEAHDAARTLAGADQPEEEPETDGDLEPSGLG